MKAYLEIEMPETCCACPLFKVNMSKQNFCKAFGAFDRSDYNKLPFERMKNCPLVPVPPHGALMDRDDFFATCPELVDGYKRITDDFVVIPAEEVRE